jgi:lambda repressor-like predicted transcriptional regulator
MPLIVYCWHLTAVWPERVLALRAKGLSLRAIAAETSVSFMTLQRIVEAA